MDNCSKCGKKLNVFDKQENFVFHGRLGYGSKYDEMILDLQLCCECMDGIIESCKHRPVHDDEYSLYGHPSK